MGGFKIDLLTQFNDNTKQFSMTWTIFLHSISFLFEQRPCKLVTYYIFSYISLHFFCSFLHSQNLKITTGFVAGWIIFLKHKKNMQMLLMYFLCTRKNLVMNSTFNVYKVIVFKYRDNDIFNRPESIQAKISNSWLES
jgi:hypothetical protein